MEFSRYFTFEELTDSREHKHMVETNRIHAKTFISSGEKLSQLLQDIRAILGGKPIKVTSGFRDKFLNAAVGSKAKTSAHMRFEAADIQHSELSAIEAFYLIIENKEKLPTLRKVILEQVGTKWLHIEVKTSESDTLAFYTTDDGKTFIKVG